MRDDGVPHETFTTVGEHGIDGMRARAEKLGGTLTAGRVEDGFEVRCVLPIMTERSSRSDHD